MIAKDAGAPVVEALGRVEVRTAMPLAPASGRDRAFAEFYQQHFRALSGYAHSLVRNPELAADMAQEALVRTFSRWVSVREPRAYAYLTVTNLAREHWRHAEVERKHMPALVDRRQSPAPDMSVRDLVNRLPPRLRDVVVLHYYADLPLDEVAVVLGRPPGTVRRRLHEARALLLAALERSDDTAS